MADIFSLTDIKVKSRIKPIKSQSVIECKCNVLSDEVSKIQLVDVKIRPAGCEVLNGEVKYSGTCLFTLIYTAADNFVKKSETMVEFSHKALSNEIKPEYKADISYCGEKADVKLSGSGYTFSCVATADINFYGNQVINLMSGGEGIMTKKEELNVCAPVTIVSASEKISEQISKSEIITQILLSSASAVIKECSCSALTVSCEGEIYLNLITEGEKGEIKSFIEKLPFKLEIKDENVMPAYFAALNVRIKNQKLSVDCYENSRKSLILADIELEITGEVFENKQTEAVTDVFSISNELETGFTKTDYICFKKVEIYTEKFSGTAALSTELESMVKIIGVCAEKAVITAYKFEENYIACDGIICGVTAYKDIEDKIGFMKIELPFSVKLPVSDISEKDIIKLDGHITNIYARCRKEKEIETDAEVKFTAQIYGVNTLNIMSGIKLLGLKPACENAIKVYFPKNTDTLWDVAKELNCDPDTIMKQNGHLTFPYEGNCMVTLYKQVIGNR